jgi:hypothetical protein
MGGRAEEGGGKSRKRWRRLGLAREMLVVNDNALDDNNNNNNNKLFPASKNGDLTSLLLVAGSH